MMLPGFTIRASIKTVGTAAVLVAALLVFYGVARLNTEPWWLKLVFGAIPGAFILGGIPWLLSGGEQGTHIEVQVGDRRVAISNLNILGQAVARFALGMLEASSAPLPPPRGALGPGSPADPANVIEGEAALPPGVQVADKPAEIPKDAGHLP